MRIGPVERMHRLYLRLRYRRGVRYITQMEGRELLDRQARKYMGMSGDQFVRRYRNGEFDVCEGEVARVAMLIPFWDQTTARRWT